MGVGIDIGSKTIKVVELEKRGDKFALKASGVIGYTGQPPELAPSEKELGELTVLVKKLIKDTKVSKKNIAISLPEHEIFTRLVNFPALTDQEIASAIKWEAEKYIPIPVSDAIIQHHIAARNETAAKPKVSVFLVAVSKDMAARYVKVVQDAGVVVSVVEPALMAMARAIAPKLGTYVMVDIGSYATGVGIVKNGLMVFSRSIPTAGNALTRAVSQYLGIDPVQAEEYKKTYGLAKDKLEDKVREAMMPVIGVLADEIKKALHFYKTEEQEENPKAVYVSGGSSSLPDLIAELSDVLGVEVATGNAFADIVMSPQEQKNISAYSSFYSVAIGLAKR